MLVRSFLKYGERCERLYLIDNWWFIGVDVKWTEGFFGTELLLLEVLPAQSHSSVQSFRVKDPSWSFVTCFHSHHLVIFIECQLLREIDCATSTNELFAKYCNSVNNIRKGVQIPLSKLIELINGQNQIDPLWCYISKEVIYFCCGCTGYLAGDHCLRVGRKWPLFSYIFLKYSETLI